MNTVMCKYPDYKKPFDLMTDASAHDIGKVLSIKGVHDIENGKRQES